MATGQKIRPNYVRMIVILGDNDPLNEGKITLILHGKWQVSANNPNNQQ
ncbi:hypothetical protein THOD04_10375 [Vibrio owensii]|nr:hypothetical protein THOD04_10375 [Vibrio owensii]